MHILIVGNSDTDRAGFIDRVLASLEPKPRLYGYRSVKEAADETGNAPIYIYPAAGPRVQGTDNLLGWCKERQSTARPEAFERYAFLIGEAKPDGLLLMDEIGPMESRSPGFCRAVMNALDGTVPILASVRDKDTPFLSEVRSHPNARIFELTQNNGEEQFIAVLEALRQRI